MQNNNSIPGAYISETKVGTEFFVPVGYNGNWQNVIGFPNHNNSVVGLNSHDGVLFPGAYYKVQRPDFRTTDINSKVQPNTSNNTIYDFGPPK
ncbi:hypothetical protein DLAC_01067 [Tieghemostelium lacteum]|uniref:Uncharacterized protein n=1 Tax=Tieghemostelium lacteum TaxID=361077 RepID=A0A152A7M6_TIELA|nr:hypothetical protein DLAC_01067 [Tieghemostelium lacteum]|eukprot:KYR02243.1 hypothetical protein DLAC_01067 [Tieghemostelium lacteum]